MSPHRSRRRWWRSRRTTSSSSRGGVFTEDLIETHIEYKMDEEVSQVRLRPHPYEFTLYYDI